MDYDKMGLKKASVIDGFEKVRFSDMQWGI